MTTLTESDLEFHFPDAINAFRYDDSEFHGLNSSMKRVDFIIEYKDCYHFIEIKDPDNPDSSNLEAFLEKFRSTKLLHDLAGKYRDSLLFRTMCEKNDKPVLYIVLLSMTLLEPAQLMNKQDRLYLTIPISHSAWKQPSASSCLVLNLEGYKNRFGPDSVRRISDGE